MMRNKTVLGASVLIWLAAGAVARAANSGPVVKPLDFDRDIRPILSENCFACHGPDEEKRKRGLRFDQKQGAFKRLKSGDYAIVPGDLVKSKLAERISSPDPDEVMPPPKTGKKLTAAQIDLLRRWIQQGAKWEAHWAYLPPERPPVPRVKNQNWPRNEIDRFILARLEKEGLKPAPEADKPTLVRRAALDLTGLPPTPAEVDAFLADSSANAYDKLVDRLLGSPRYGEQMARYWLDAARYADSHGYHIDSERSIWKYREWVIDAFNDNMPFNRFTVEQLAGDLLPEATTGEKIASGYIRCNMSTGEGGAIEAEYQAKYTFDRVETTSTIWLGLTMTCARCHTHKYDPIQHREYYGLYALFNNLDESIMDGNVPNPSPFIKVPTPQQTERRAWLQQHIADIEKKIAAPVPEIDTAQAAWENHWREKLNTGWTTLAPVSVKSTATNAPEFRILDDRSVLVEGPNPESDVHEVTARLDGGTIAALRLETLPHDSLPGKSAARADDGRFELSEFEAEIIGPGGAEGRGKAEKLKFTHAVADVSAGDHDIGRAIDGKADTGWSVEDSGAGDPHLAVFVPDQPVHAEDGSELHIRLHYQASKSKRAIGHFRLAVTASDVLVKLLEPPEFQPWHEIGPFKSPDAKAAFSQVYEPEKEIDLEKSYPGFKEDVKWEKRPGFTDGKSNLLVEDLHGLHGVRYLYRTLRLPEDRKVEVGLRADGLFKLWVNGRLVFERDHAEKTGEGLLKATIELQKGENKFLAKVVTVQGAAYFTFTKDLGDADVVPPDLAGLFATSEKTPAKQLAKVRDHYRRTHLPEFRQLFESVERWREEDAAIDKAIPTTMVAKELAKPRDTFELMRGEYDKKGEKVEPGVPSILPPWLKGQPKNRLGFARWLVDPGHPLTARVTVNRDWQHYFGIGLVKTTEDFGVQGERPSNPELLDWLATEFIRTGWDVKRMQRLMVTSAAYRQSSRVTPELLAKDPENRLLARGPRFRLDAEAIRDTALAVSGLLVEREGGHSVKPYQPPGLWEAVSYGNQQKYVPDSGEAEYRRSLYTYWKRQSPPPSMLLFDAPSREYCAVRRSRSNTPLQALALLNDPQFVEASRAFGQRIMLEGGKSPKSRAVYGFRLAAARKPAANEVKVILDVFNQELARFRKDKPAAEKYLKIGDFKPKANLDPAELAAWTTIASMILNLDETLTKG
ncbi:MAG: PSD1 and planctomycete cytochrome C domain-containing protein [Limisphaerales bacterium]